MKKKWHITTSLYALLLTGCGIHGQSASDLPKSLQNITIISTSRETNNFKVALSRRLRALGVHIGHPSKNTTKMILKSLDYQQSIPSYSNASNPQYISGSSRLCFEIITPNQKKHPLPQCVSQSQEYLVNFSTSFNPSTQEDIRRQTQERVEDWLINRLTLPSTHDQLK